MGDFWRLAVLRFLAPPCNRGCDEHLCPPIPGDRSGYLRTLHGAMEPSLGEPLPGVCRHPAGRSRSGRRLRHGCRDARLGGASRHRSHPAVTYELADARHMPYADDSFDGCVSMLALDVMPEVHQVVQEMRRVTRSGGVLGPAQKLMNRLLRE